MRKLQKIVLKPLQLLNHILKNPTKIGRSNKEPPIPILIAITPTNIPIRSKTKKLLSSCSILCEAGALEYCIN